MHDAQTVNNVTMYVVTVLPDHGVPGMQSGLPTNVNFEVH